jgi:hypothetical protein
MMQRRPVLWILAATVLASCATVSEAKAPEDVTIELAAVTLGDDCPAPAPASVPVNAPASPAVVATPSDAPAPGKASPAARCAGPSCGRMRCDQTSMQLTIATQPATKPTTIKGSKVELLDDKGKVLEVLTAREPTRWDTDKYVTWDEALAPRQSVKASYALSAPSWDKLTNGRWNAHTRTFQLRVTVTIGTGTRTVQRQSITAARLPPAVPT